MTNPPVQLAPNNVVIAPNAVAIAPNNAPNNHHEDGEFPSSQLQQPSQSPPNPILAATSLAGDSSDDDDEAYLPCVELHKIHHSNSESLLLSLATGLKDGDRKLGDVEVEPHKSAPQKRKFSPSKEKLHDEVMRRLKKDCSPMKKLRCTSWAKSKLIDWLKKHPRTTKADVEFIIAEEQTFHQNAVDFMSLMVYYFDLLCIMGYWLL